MFSAGTKKQEEKCAVFDRCPLVSYRWMEARVSQVYFIYIRFDILNLHCSLGERGLGN